jgi:pSer/pThr/pTyr-binding forkhead associated (FHA) protein
MIGKLYLKIIESSYNQKEGETRVVDKTIFRIGREKDNDWIIDCPTKIISRHHCFIEFINNSYVINDLSKNGLFINNSRLPIGAGNCSLLNDGDTLILPGLKISVVLSELDAITANDKFLALLPSRQNEINKQENGIDTLISEDIVKKDGAISSLMSLQNQINHIQSSIENTKKIKSRSFNLGDGLSVNEPQNINYDRVSAEKAVFRSALLQPMVIPEDWNKHDENELGENERRGKTIKKMEISPVLIKKLLLPLMAHFERIEQALSETSSKKLMDLVSEDELRNFDEKNIDDILRHIDVIVARNMLVLSAFHDRLPDKSIVDTSVFGEIENSPENSTQIKPIDSTQSFKEFFVGDNIDEF